MSTGSKKTPWAKWDDEQLLGVRLCDLGVSIRDSILQERIDRVQTELDRKHLRFKPYFWLSDDWFTPEGVTGVAVPFFLAHPRLVKLERNQMSEVEGGSREGCLKILRHEVGHAIDHAFELHRRRKWQRLFGPTSRRYPTGYRPNPYSRRHVLNLEYWYAQAHPDEDFAETFAVWLQPRSQWRKRYQSWPRAMEKLEYVDELMRDLAGVKPQVSTRTRVDSLPRLRIRLGDYYQEKLRVHGKDFPDYYDGVLRRHFQLTEERTGAVPAWTLLRQVRPQVLCTAAGWSGDPRYQLDHMLRDMAGRCQELGLYAKDPAQQSRPEFVVRLARHALNSLYRHRRWVQM
jgi:hypothetical protein